MSGHSKWATIKHRKAQTDARRGHLFTRLIKEITVAARVGGGDPDANPRLRKAIAAAKAENMPADNIERALQRGTGQLPGSSIEEAVLEGYGPGGVAILIEIATDNRNRTVNELRHIFSKFGGNLGESGCVAWMFHKKGHLTLPKEKVDEDTLLGIVLDAGAEDLRDDGTNWEILTLADSLDTVKEALEKHQLTPTTAEVTMLPQSTVRVEGGTAQQLLRLLEAVEEQEDTQHVYSNFDMPEQILQEAMATSESSG
ncbi:MAG: YebC/PmpR family DNA-binding transcriptional regulator [Acidobacteria bacterium]|nr:YebC/PmpR family DNA-binding transcriptional regulator [Acidobacteriota bacterium]